MTLLPKDNSLYKTQAYWEQRYHDLPPEEDWDWFKSYRDLQPHLEPWLPDKNASILMVGCGNSTLSANLYDDGYRSVTNVDFSPTLIDRMRLRHHLHRPEMKWLVMDIRCMISLATASFDIVLDKGTLDALLCEKGGDVWNPSAEVVEDVRREVDEVERVLKPGGVFLYITFGQPHFRRRHLERPGWSVQVKTLGEGGFHYFLYVMRKSLQS